MTSLVLNFSFNLANPSSFYENLSSSK